MTGRIIRRFRIAMHIGVTTASINTIGTGKLSDRAVIIPGMIVTQPTAIQPLVGVPQADPTP